MTCAVHVVWDERLTDYHFGPGHPLAPVRLELTMRLAHELGLWSQPGVTVADPVPVADAELECVLGRSASADHQRAPAPADMFPFTGLPAETGGPGAEGSVVNVTLPAGIKDARWLRALHAIVPPLLAQFRPQILVSQHGADTHRLDPLAHLELSIDGQRAAHAAVHALAHDLAGGRWLLTGGGGYELVRVVPRSWTHLLAEAAGQPIDPRTPTPAR